MKIHKELITILLIVSALVVRIIPINFPVFSADDARIAARGEMLVHSGTDELGRKFPLIFNSLEDYQLPLTSYMTALGILIFGKTDLGARVPFIIFGTVLVFLSYKVTKNFFKDGKIPFFALIITAFSPALIYFSKFPNEFIIFACLLLLLINFLMAEKLNRIIIPLIIICIFLTTKIFWIAIIPLTFLILHINTSLQRKDKIYLILFTVILSVAIILVFIKIPQGPRSLVENNFSSINDMTVKNGIERLRSQTLPGWPVVLDKILFNKMYTLIASFSNWLQLLQLSTLFAQLDKNGQFGFLGVGAFPKITIIPFVLGIFYLIREKKNKIKYLPILVIILTFPLLFLFPNIKVEYLLVAIPIIGIIISLGFINLSPKITGLILSFAIFEVVANLFFINSNIRNTENFRPLWINQLITDGYKLSLNNNIAYSDNFTEDLIPHIQWLTPASIKLLPLDLSYPYKYRQTELTNIKMVGESNTFYVCDDRSFKFIFATKRELERLGNKATLVKVYRNDLGKEFVTLNKIDLCIN